MTQSSHHTPPRWGEWLLARFVSGQERALILGDLAEEYTYHCSSVGVSAARRWYRRQVLTSISPLSVRAVHKMGTILGHALRGGLHNISKNDLSSVISILGLPVFIGVSLIAYIRGDIIMFNSLVQNLTPAAEGFLVSWMILVVLIAGIWASATNRTFPVNRLGKLSLGLGFMGAIYSLIKSFSALGNPNIDKALKGDMLAVALDASMAFVLLGFAVFAVLVVWDMFKHKSATSDVPVAQE